MTGDTSEQQRLQAALEDSEQRLRDFAACASDWFWETGTDHRYTYVSNSAFDLDDTSLTGRGLAGDVVDPASENWSQHVAGVKAHRPFMNFEEHYEDRDGLVRTLRTSGTPFFDADQRFLGYRGTSTDLTEIKQTKMELNKSRGRLAEMLAIAPDAIIVVDHRQNIKVFNEGAENVFGYKAEKMLGQSLNELLPEEFRAGHGRHFRQFAKSPESTRLMSLRGEIAGQRKDGTVFPAEATISKFEAGGETIFTILLQDISGRRGMERDLVHAKEQAEIANRAKSDFLANMSHELRTPLNAVIGFSEVVLQQMHGPLGSPKYLEYAQDILDSGKHLLSVINDILDLSKIEAGQFDLSEEDIDLQSLVGRCLNFVKTRATKKGVQLENSVYADLPYLRADPRIVMQILTNLLTNSVKFTEPGGRVSIAASLDARGRYYIEVADTGCGIPEEDFEMVLTPFEQSHNAVRQKEGTGLGLPLAKSFIERHGGKLELRSEVGKGTTVALTFPVARVIARTPDNIVAQAGAR